MRIASQPACIILFAAAMAIGRADPDEVMQRTFRIEISTRDVMKEQDWSGQAAISKGRITRVGKTSGASDTIHEDMTWTMVYGRSLKGQPDKRPNEKALVVTVEAPEDAMLLFKTKGGDFAFRVNEIPDAHAIDKLGGNVRVSLAENDGEAAAAAGERGGKGKAKGGTLGAAQIAGELSSAAVTDGARQSDWPAIAATAGGALWCAYVEWDGAGKDRVLLRRRDAGAAAWGEPIAIDDGGWDHYWPAVAADGEGAIVVWSGQEDGNVDLQWATVDASGKPTKPRRLTDAPHTDFHARLKADGKGGAYLAWQSFRDGQSDIYARHFLGGVWGVEVRLSPSEAHDWQPDIAVDKNGAAWVSWDGYENGNYDVYLRRLDGLGPGPVIPVTTAPEAEFHSTVTVDGLDRVWIAWDSTCQNWGKDLSTSSSAPGNEGLHASRSIGVRVYAEGAIQEPGALPEAAFTGMMTRYAELPQLAVDGKGTPWLIFRHWTEQKPTEIFGVYATRMEKGGWAKPWRLTSSSGQNTQWASIAPMPAGGLGVAYASDLRSPENLPKDQIHALVYRVQFAALDPGDGLPHVALKRVELPAPVTRRAVRPRATLEAGGKGYSLMLGDCHRHTDIRGHSAVDGSLMDTFRYALDAGQLDYLGLGDHNEVAGGSWPDGLRDYQWWWTQKACDLFNTPPTFVALYSYEHSMGSPAGHRNMIFLKRGAPLRMIDRETAKLSGKGLKPENPGNMPPQLWLWVRQNVLSQPGQKCVIVPHTFAAGPLAVWDWPNDEFDCLLEMYQGCRGSYEKWGLPEGEKRGGTQTKQQGHFAQDALDRGNVYGFVSFSDHKSTHNSWGCVWAETATREGIIDGMLARRTYAATDEILLRVTAVGHPVGEAFEAQAASPPPIEIDIQAPDQILRVDVVRNGQFIWTKNPKARTFQTTFRDAGATPGKAYYYVRAFQRDPEKPDGDPEIAWSSPFFVTYK